MTEIRPPEASGPEVRHASSSFGRNILQRKPYANAEKCRRARYDHAATPESILVRILEVTRIAFQIGRASVLDASVSHEDQGVNGDAGGRASDTHGPAESP